MSFSSLRRRGQAAGTIHTQGPRADRDPDEAEADQSVVRRVVEQIGATWRDVIDWTLAPDGTNLVVRVGRVFDVDSQVRATHSGARARTVQSDAQPSRAYTEISIPATYNKRRLLTRRFCTLFLLVTLVLLCAVLFIAVRTHGYQSPIDVVKRHLGNALGGE